MRQRHNLILHLLLPLLLFLGQLSTLEAAALQYENQQIEKLDITIETCAEGEQSSARSIGSHLKTRVDGFFSQSEFDTDLKSLIRDFDRVEPLLETIDGKLHITIKLWEKPTIRTISWCGNTHIDSTALQGELGIKRFSVFDRLSFTKAFHKIKSYYVKEGFFEAEVDYTTSLDCATNEVDIAITVVEGRAGHIDRIRFCGFTKCEEEDIIDLMVTKEYNYFLSWYTHEGIYHEEAAQQDQFLIVNYLQNLGFADAKVEIAILEKCKNKIELVITATKGEIYRVGTVSFSGNTLFCNEDIERLFSFGRGSPYSLEKIRATTSRITDLYGRKGYIDAAVDFAPSLDFDTRTYAVKITIDEGAQHRVGLIKVFGNCTTQTSVILHESLLIPGDIFNIDKLKNTEQKLKNVGYFEEVNVYAVKSEGPMGLGDLYRDVHIEVKETSTGHFGAFAGYSTTESLFGGFNITERNFSYRGLGSIWSNGLCGLRGGGEYAHGTIQVGLKSRKYVISWAKPFFMDSQWTVGFDIEQSNNRYISSDYEINSTALITHANYRYNDFVRIGWHYRLKNSYVTLNDRKHHHHSDSDSKTPQGTGSDKKKHQGSGKKKGKAAKEKPAKDPVAKDPIATDPTTTNAIATKSLEEDAEIDGLISATGVSITYDSTDHPVTPRNGFRSNFDIEFAGVGGDHTFFSLAYLNAYFIPLGKKNVLRYRADFRFILPIGGTGATTVPIDERLFLGGDSMVRGFRSYRLGPFYKKNHDPKGGVSEQFYSVEFARRFHDRIEAFGFVDAGYLSLDTFSWGRPYCALGLGARVKIMENIPSLTFGYGVPLNPKNNSQVKRFFISIGGKF